MKDFTRERATAPLEFKVDGDTFQAAAVLNADQKMKAISLVNSLGTTQLDGIALGAIDPNNATQADVERARNIASAADTAALEVMGILDELLLPESAKRFAERMKSKTEPIELEQVFDIFQWLISEYGQRPTSPLVSSSNGHSGTGTPSTVGTQASE